MTIEALKEQARRHEQREEWQKALELYLKAIRRLEEDDQPDIALYNRVGDIEVRVGRVDRAVEHYEQAVDLYLEAELPNNAIAVCKKVVRNVPTRHAIFLKMGQIRANQGFLIDARHNFLTYAERMQSQGELEEAFRALVEFVELAPEDVETRLALAGQLEAHGRRDEAVDQLLQARRRLVRSGREEEVTELEERIRQLAPDATIPVGAEEGGAGDDDFRLQSTALVEDPEGPPADEIEVQLGEIQLGGDPGGEGEAGGANVAEEPEADLPVEGSSGLEALEVGDPGDEAPGAEGTGGTAGRPPDSGEAPSRNGAGPDADGAKGAPGLDGLEVFEAFTAPAEGLETAGGDPLPLLHFDDEDDADASTGPREALGEALTGGDEPGMAGDLDGPADLPLLSEDTGEEPPLRPVPLDLDEDGLDVEALDGIEAAAEPADLEMGALDLDDLDELPVPEEAAEEVEVERFDLDALDDLEVAGGGGEPGEPASFHLDELDVIGELQAADQEDVREEAASFDLDALDGLEAPEEGDGLDVVELEVGAVNVDLQDFSTVPLLDEPALDLDAPDGLEATEEETDPAGEPEEEDGPSGPLDVEERRESSWEDAAAFSASGGDGDAGVGAPSREAVEAGGPDDAVAPGADPTHEDGPEEPAEWRALGDSLVEQGEAARAGDAYQRAHAAFAARDELAPAMEVVRSLIAMEPDAVDHHQRLVEYAFRSNDREVLVPAYLGLADCLQRNGEAAKARGVFQQVLAMEPGNAHALEAVGAMESPSAPPVATVASTEDYVDLGALILEDEEEEKTTRWKVAAEEPSGDEAADFARMLSQFKAKVAENVDADDLKAHYDLGTAYREMGLLDEAIAEFQVALRAGGNHLPTYELLGQCFLDKGQPEVAIRSLSRALEMPAQVEDEMLGIYYYLGRAHQELGNSGPAREFYEKVFSLDINFQDVTERLRALRM